MVQVTKTATSDNSGSYRIGLGHQGRFEEKTLKAVNQDLNEAFSKLHELKHEKYNDLKMKMLSLQSEVSSAIDGAEERFNRND